MSNGTQTIHYGEGDGKPVVKQVGLPEHVRVLGPWRHGTDDHLKFRAAWFAEFRARWRRDLYSQRIIFAARMAALREEP